MNKEKFHKKVDFVGQSRSGICSECGGKGKSDGERGWENDKTACWVCEGTGVQLVSSYSPERYLEKFLDHYAGQFDIISRV